MDNAAFEDVFVLQIGRVSDVLLAKAKEYGTSDRLHNFKVAAALRQVTPIQALEGMLAKHTVSVYDMMRSDQKFTNEQWDEKITDHINYLILLRALVEEDNQQPATTASKET